MGPIVANLQKTGPGVFSVTGAYISQPGEWDIALAAQRVQDLDLNYEFTAKVTNAPSVSNGGSTLATLAGAPISLANNMQESSASIRFICMACYCISCSCCSW